MPKRVVYYVSTVVALAAAAAAVWFFVFHRPKVLPEDVLVGYDETADYTGLTIQYPLDASLFPPEIVAPTFRWEDAHERSDVWLVTIKLPDTDRRLSSCVEAAEWTPSDDQWDLIQEHGREQDLTVAVLGVNRRRPAEILSGAKISIATSSDEIGAPLFYREVHLPFIETVNDPAKYIRWRFGAVSSKEQPPIVFEKLPVCGNCHSFSADGGVMGMDVDYANDKGSYAITPVSQEIVLDESKIITWSDFRRDVGRSTFGLLSQVSPDGRYVVSTVKDKSVFVPRDDLAFSQLFFPVMGILVVYDRELGTFQSLAGADDERFVQSNPVWSPDGKHIVFARAKAYRLPNLHDEKTVLLTEDECSQFLKEGKQFQFDLYRIPFNGGKGGEARPLEGASHNGVSNYFPRYSPDGKWIVFCQAKSFMLLQPDSRLFIMPASGGEPRLMRCNTPRMNSWHTWSPNGKWLVFSAKPFSAYTQLFLTHVDEQGRSTPPIVLSHFTDPDKAANIPEFVNLDPHAIKRIREAFITDVHYYRAGTQALTLGDLEIAVREYQRALELNPNHEEARNELGVALLEQGQDAEAEAHFTKLIELNPEFPHAHSNLGNSLARQGKYQEAIASLREALRLTPEHAASHLILSKVLSEFGHAEEAAVHLARAREFAPEVVGARRALEQGDASLAEGSVAEAVRYYRRSLEEYPEFVPALVRLASVLATTDDQSLRRGEEAVRLATRACELTRLEDANALSVLATCYAELGQFQNAVGTAERALQLARDANDVQLVGSITRQLELYRQR
ncbi:MAG: tetratricopeptide repeat protein [Planctomycetota bacterium]|jgi:tetratricopeptide (TPR) repeat protein